jgi:hypothetical protein
MIKSGEKYGYTSYLCCQKLYPARVKFVYQDTACKYGQWYANAREKGANAQGDLELQQLLQQQQLVGQQELFLQGPGPAKHVLAEAHGRLHSLWCWVSL